MICDIGKAHYVKTSLGNGRFSNIWELKTNADFNCTAQDTVYVDVNGDGYDDIICDNKGSHKLILLWDNLCFNSKTRFNILCLC